LPTSLLFRSLKDERWCLHPSSKGKDTSQLPISYNPGAVPSVIFLSSFDPSISGLMILYCDASRVVERETWSGGC